METPIDFVITWVNVYDGEWNEAYRKHKEEYCTRADRDKILKTDGRKERYRDWGLLKYWFRGVEKYAPWVRKIHFITYGQLPKWLEEENPKLHVVRHGDYIPEKFLPTFNSNVLELYLHEIEGLSERFVYFNDDMFLMKKTAPEDFFRKGKPCDMLAFQPVVANPSNPIMSRTLLNNSLVLSKYFSKRENVKRQPGKYFKIGYPPLYFWYNLLELYFPRYTGFYTVHGPSPFCKSTFKEVWEKERELLEQVSLNRFRSAGDVTQYLFREWQKLSGNFEPLNLHRFFGYYEIGDDNEKLLKEMKKRKHRIICINDARVSRDEDAVRAELCTAFEMSLPEKSAFEREALEEAL
ncbi:MAG: stealth conserved region 3 domain-containing protein [Bacteroidales bacterium]|nr:stealth conserved region 3 domain-containing protein [Lachnoclostridium sp.]MCM1383633.1 stealth conserved region 3 domain-containing protein [Lachnoclostridium sp.]MCM1465715.1 stealth conserved region 3 domain-containing protein [Bacteroidales bacterium]